MRNIWKIILSDFKRMSSSVVVQVILMGIIVVPCLFAWFNILSNWDPFEPESTGKIPVAVATEDQGTDMLGLNINVGDKFIDAVNGNDMIGWDTDCGKKKAVEGVYAGDYYAAIIIPKDFSEKMLSFATGQPEHPKILFYENKKMNAISPKITGTVRTVLEEEIDKTFIDTLGQYITEAANAAKEAGLEPEEAFGDLSDTLTDLSTELESSMIMIQSAAGLSDAASDLLDASDELIGSSEATLDLGQQLLKSAEGRIPEKADTSSAEKLVDEIAAILSKDLAKTKSDLTAVRNDMGKFNQFVASDLDKHLELAKAMKKSTDKIAADLKKMGMTGLASRFSRISGKLDDMINKLGKLEKADAGNWSLMQGYIDDILANIDFSQKSIKKIKADVDGKLDKKLNKAIRSARNSISDTRDALSGIYGDMDLLGDSLSRSDKALGSLNSGLAGAAAVLSSLQNGSRNLAELFDSLAGSDMVSDVNHLMTNDAAVIAENMASPIKMKTERIYPIRNFGSIMAPFYHVIALWIGALFAAVMLRTKIKRREEDGQIRLHEAFFGRYALFLSIGLAQALLLCAGELLYVGIQCLHPLRFILASCLISLVFTMIIYGLVFALENIGLAVSVIVMILQVAGAGGTFPVQVLPPVFKAMFPIMPFKYAMDAIRECIGGMYDHTYIKCLLILLIFALGAAAFGLLLHKPMRGIIEKVEESKRESDVML